MSATLDKIIEEVRTLTPEERQQLLEMLERESGISEHERRIALARSVRGKYAHIPTSSEAFAAMKREETKREDSKFGDRR